MPPQRVHHVNFVVRDLEKAASRFEQLLTLDPFEFLPHPDRNVRVARTRVGETWLVLVCPADENSTPGRFLATRGEGVCLVSFGVDSLQEELDRVRIEDRAGDGTRLRGGVADWQVFDLCEMHGTVVQLAEDPSRG